VVAGRARQHVRGRSVTRLSADPGDQDPDCCGRFAGISSAQMCFMAPIATHNAGVEGSIPSLSTNDLRALSITRRKVGVGVSWDFPIRSAASNNRLISAAL
jgi:hypothetical protein